MMDPGFLKEAKERKMDIEPMSGDAVQKIIKKTVAVTPALVRRAKAAIK